jgi:hypothetical protein
VSGYSRCSWRASSLAEVTSARLPYRATAGVGVILLIA